MKRNRAVEVVRGALKIAALLAVIVWFAGVWLVRREVRRDLAARAAWLQAACNRSLRVLGVRVVERGPRPVGGLMVAPNHLGYLDILVLAASMPTVFVAKKEVSGWPVFGWMAARAGTRFIDRERNRDLTRVSAELNEAIRAGVAVAVFLEGTSTSGDHVARFKSSLLEPAVTQSWQVAPAAISYRVPVGRSAQNEVCWWGDMTLLPHLANFATLAWVEADLTWGETETARGNRKWLAEKLRDRVTKLKNGVINS